MHRLGRLLAAAALVLLPLLAPGRVARAGDEVLSTPFLGPDGEVKALFGPEFQDAPGLFQDLATFGIEGLGVGLAGPLVPDADPRKPPVPSRLLLSGPPEVVAEAREVLNWLDVPSPSVAVSLLAAEVRCASERERGGSLLFDRRDVKDAPGTLFRGAAGNYDPESYLRSSLMGTLPFQGTTLVIGNDDSDWTQNGVFELVMRMLQNERQISILAWPTIVCTEGEPALIESSVKRPDHVIRTAGAYVSFQGDTRSSGISLTVIPIRVSRAGAVLDLRADIGVLLPEDPSDLAASDWIETRRAVATRVTVRDRESLMIGGIRMRRHAMDRAQDPVFGRIPGAREVASSRSTKFVETELILLIRARVLVPDSPVGITLPPGEARRLGRAARARPGRLGER
jgi:type II secretory pathway component GspD/PulD (secretin)